MLLSAAWTLQKGLSLGGLAVALAGVATFGWHFVRINAAAAQGDSSEIPPESWRGAGARYGLSIFARRFGAGTGIHDSGRDAAQSILKRAASTQFFAMFGQPLSGTTGRTDRHPFIVMRL